MNIKRATRTAVNDFIEGLGYKLDDVCTVEILPDRVVVIEYLRGIDGTLRLSPLGARTCERHHHIEDDT